MKAEPVGAIAAQSLIAELSDGWQLTKTPPDAIALPSELASCASWTPAVVPGTVADALRTAGTWSWSSGESLDASDWWYRLRFAHVSGGSEHLCLDGLATIADVWLNGTHLLRSENMFVPHRVAVGDLLRAENELVIRFAALSPLLAARRPRPRWKTRLVAHQNLRWFRTTLLGRMPGWSSGPEPVGPWRRISIVGGLRAVACAASVVALLRDGDGLVTVTVPQLDDALVMSDAMVTVGGTSARLVFNGLEHKATVRIRSPKRWWPHTHGDQCVYPVSLSAGGETIELSTVGFRDVVLDSGDGNFELSVNGEPVFARGACWVPPDVVKLSAPREEYRRTLTLARDAGMNMIRVGGTMVYEDDAFYDICDELGILVWQECMFANMDYPAADTKFAADCAREIGDQLRRIGRHPCLVLVCGNNEVQQQAAMLGLGRPEWSNALFDEVIPAAVASLCPSATYWSSSPSGGSLPFHVNEGDGHYFGYGPYLREAADVRASAVRFASETLAIANVPSPASVDRISCGPSGAGHHPAWKAAVPRDNGASWDFEDVRDHYVAKMFGVDPLTVRYEDPERYLALGRAASAELMTRAMNEWRREQSSCNGALVWTLRDLRDGAGWGVCDSAGEPKSAYFALKRVLGPVALLATDEGLNGLALEIVNETQSSLDCSLRVSLYRDAVETATATTRAVVGARSHAGFAAEEVLGGFSDITYAYRFGPLAHDVVVATLESSTGDRLAETFYFPGGAPSQRSERVLTARIERIDADECVLSVMAARGAFAIEIDARGWDVDDNYFHLAPGRERRVRIRQRAYGARVMVVSALNASDTVRVAIP